METALRIHTERTPNPASVKWVVGTTILDDPRPVSFGAGTAPEVSPLAARILAINGVTDVLLGPDVITVSKAEEFPWRDLGQTVTQAIREWAAAGEPALGPGARRRDRSADSSHSRSRNRSLRGAGWRRDQFGAIPGRRGGGRSEGCLRGLSQFDHHPQDGGRSAAARGNSRGPLRRRPLGGNLKGAVLRESAPPGRADFDCDPAAKIEDGVHARRERIRGRLSPGVGN